MIQPFVWWISLLSSLFIFQVRELWIIPLYDSKLDVAKWVLLKKKWVLLKKKCVCEVESMEVSCPLILAMENGWKYIILFYLEDVR